MSDGEEFGFLWLSVGGESDDRKLFFGFSFTCRRSPGKEERACLSLKNTRVQKFMKSKNILEIGPLRLIERKRMWRLKIAQGGDPCLYSTNNFVGRQTWEFDPNYANPQELHQVEIARQHFHDNRFHVKPSSDALLHIQLLKENNFQQTIPPVKIGENEDVTHEAATATLRRAIRFYSALQAIDGHWPAENAGPLFFLPPLVMCLYITGHLNTIFQSQHQREILRYIYNHQNQDGGWGLHIEGHSTMFCTTLIIPKDVRLSDLGFEEQFL